MVRVEYEPLVFGARFGKGASLGKREDETGRREPCAHGSSIRKTFAEQRERRNR